MDSSPLKNVFHALAELIQEPIQIDCDEEGLSCQAMCTSHVCLIDIALHASGFSEYVCEEKMSIGLLMPITLSAFKCSYPGDEVEITASKPSRTEPPEGIKIAFKNNYVKSEFYQKTVLDDPSHMEIPDKEYECELTLPSKDFNKICRDLSVISPTVSIEFSRDQVVFAAGDERNTGELVLQENNEFEDDKAVRVKCKERMKEEFAVRYLVQFSKFPLAKSVTVSMADDAPFQVLYNLGELGYVRFFLAPKLNS